METVEQPDELTLEAASVHTGLSPYLVNLAIYSGRLVPVRNSPTLVVRREDAEAWARSHRLMLALGDPDWASGSEPGSGAGRHRREHDAFRGDRGALMCPQCGSPLHAGDRGAYACASGHELPLNELVPLQDRQVRIALMRTVREVRDNEATARDLAGHLGPGDGQDAALQRAAFLNTLADALGHVLLSLPELPHDNR